jgi:hypothetical protein
MNIYGLKLHRNPPLMDLPCCHGTFNRRLSAIWPGKAENEKADTLLHWL